MHTCVMCACMCTCGTQRAANRNWFSSSTMWITGMEFRFPTMVASAFYPPNYLRWHQDLFFENIHKSSFLGKPKSAVFYITDGETPFCRDRLEVF